MDDGADDGGLRTVDAGKDLTEEIRVFCYVNPRGVHLDTFVLLCGFDWVL